ncbi:unnamed protein product [Albugo candida]|uniref:Uncharacterized protein n=1 Tax=Albugo candida TaxID=65357 RepID=A0A024FWN4_9STRA|nr:unnamed protein product [Albugo candida]|eukprot:CCI11342.1 unnamed protein product [Albugo candida]
MGPSLRAYFCVATQLSAWLCCWLHFAQCEKYSEYKVILEESRGELHTCYNAIIDVGAKRIRPIEIKGVIAKVIVHSETNLLAPAIRATFPRNCRMRIVDGKFPTRLNEVLYGKELAIFSVESQRNLLINLKIEIHKEYTIFWRQVDYKLYWCRGGEEDIDKLEKTHPFLFAPIELFNFMMKNGKRMEETSVHVSSNMVGPVLAGLLLQIEKFSSRILYKATYDISHSEECHDILRIRSDDRIFMLSPSESGNHDLVMLSIGPDSYIIKSTKCQFTSVYQDSFNLQFKENIFEHLAQVNVNQANLRSNDVVVVTYQQDQGQNCVECTEIIPHNIYSTPLSSIIKASIPAPSNMLRIRLRCVHESESPCTSVMLRPARDYNILENLNGGLLPEEEAVYSIEIAKVGILPYNGKKECAKCLFRYFEVFYSDPMKKELWVNIKHPRNVDCQESCGPLYLSESQFGYNYLPPRPMRFFEDAFR